jgi:hypothetical protein
MPLRSDWSSATCPIAHAADTLADPWVLLILRELFSGRSRFDELRAATGIAESVLARRLRLMTEQRLVERATGAERTGPGEPALPSTRAGLGGRSHSTEPAGLAEGTIPEKHSSTGTDGYRLTDRGIATLPVLHAYARFTRDVDPEGPWGLTITCRRCGTVVATGDWCATCAQPIDLDSTVWCRRSMGASFALADQAAIR